MRHPSEYVARAIGGLRGYLRGGMMPVSSVSVFRTVGASKAKVSTTLTDIIISHDSNVGGVNEAQIDGAERVISLRIMRGTPGGWPFAGPPEAGEEYDINGVRYTAQWVDHWVLGWKLRLTENERSPH